jgi:rare lipoprotein A
MIPQPMKLACVAALLLAACSSTPPLPGTPASPPDAAAPPVKRGGYYKDDGPEAHPPVNLDAVPDAVPRVEPLRTAANRTYVALGETYTPDSVRKPYGAVGIASWYGKRFHGHPTSSGDAYDMYAMTAAHRTLPIPSYARVTSLTNGKTVVVRVNDRGPFDKKRLIDLSYTAAYKLGFLGHGSTRVHVEAIDPAQDDIAGNRFAPGIYLQLGAFSHADNAQKLLQKIQAGLAADGPAATIVLADDLHRVSVGPYANDAAATADSVRYKEQLGLTPVKRVRSIPR